MAKCAKYPILFAHGMYAWEGINRCASYWGASAGRLVDDLKPEQRKFLREHPEYTTVQEEKTKRPEIERISGCFCCRYRQKTQKQYVIRLIFCR